MRNMCRHKRSRTVFNYCWRHYRHCL